MPMNAAKKGTPFRSSFRRDLRRLRNRVLGIESPMFLQSEGLNLYNIRLNADIPREVIKLPAWQNGKEVDVLDVGAGTLQAMAELRHHNPEFQKRVNVYGINITNFPNERQLSQEKYWVTLREAKTKMLPIMEARDRELWEMRFGGPKEPIIKLPQSVTNFFGRIGNVTRGIVSRFARKKDILREPFDIRASLEHDSRAFWSNRQHVKKCWVGSIETHNLGDKTFDLIVSATTIDHLGYRDLALANIANHLKPGGVAILEIRETPNPLLGFYAFSFAPSRFEPFKSAAEKKGFRVELTEATIRIERPENVTEQIDVEEISI